MPARFFKGVGLFRAPEQQLRMQQQAVASGPISSQLVGFRVPHRLTGG